MTVKIVTEYSLWLTPLCLLLAIAYAMFLYYKEKRYEFKKNTTLTLFILRVVTIFIIAFLLLSPLLMSIKRTVEKPIIIVAQDNSQSIVFTKDSSNIRNKYLKELDELISELKNNYDVKTFSFGDKVKEGITGDFTDKQTDFSELFDEIKSRYANRNVGAMILASDGLYNKGSNPLYDSEKFKFPFYTIALGDTTVQKDLIISKINYNRITYLGNNFPLEIIITADKCSGQKTTLNISRGNENLYTQTIDITNEHFIETIQVYLEAKQAGMQRYRVTLTTLPGEISYINNVQDIYVEVLEGREKILLLAGAPHPDISALKQSIETNDIYQVEVFLPEQFNKPLNSYNLVILHQLPYKGKNHQQLLQSIFLQKIPILYILGSSSDLNFFNTMKTGLNIRQSGDKTDEATAYLSGDFALFTLSDELKKILINFPAMQVAFGDYNKSNAITVLFYQKIGSVQTQKPLVMFNTESNPKIGIIAGEGFWRWRLNNFLQTGNQNAFNELMNKIIQYLSVKEDKGRFRINHKVRFMENEAVEFDAEVYNDSYELVNDAEVKITISNQEQKNFPFTFSRTAHAYHLNAGVFPLGEYRYNAQTKVGNTILQKSGVFSVVPVNIESLNLIANHQLLFSIAIRNDGKMIFPGQLKQLTQWLDEREDITSISYTKKSFSDAVNIFWILMLIILLLSAEWFIRRRYGAY